MSLNYYYYFFFFLRHYDEWAFLVLICDKSSASKWKMFQFYNFIILCLLSLRKQKSIELQAMDKNYVIATWHWHEASSTLDETSEWYCITSHGASLMLVSRCNEQNHELITKPKRIRIQNKKSTILNKYTENLECFFKLLSKSLFKKVLIKLQLRVF